MKFIFFLKKIKAKNFTAKQKTLVNSKLMLHLADKTLANLSLALSHFKYIYKYNYIVSESPNSPNL